MQASLRSYVTYPRPPLPPPLHLSRQQSVYLSHSSFVSPFELILTGWGGGGEREVCRWARSQTIQPRESLVLCKFIQYSLSNTFFSSPHPPFLKPHLAAKPGTTWQIHQTVAPVNVILRSPLQIPQFKDYRRGIPDRSSLYREK